MQPFLHGAGGSFGERPRAAFSAPTIAGMGLVAPAPGRRRTDRLPAGGGAGQLAAAYRRKQIGRSIRWRWWRGVRCGGARLLLASLAIEGRSLAGYAAPAGSRPAPCCSSVSDHHSRFRHLVGPDAQIPADGRSVSLLVPVARHAETFGRSAAAMKIMAGLVLCGLLLNQFGGRLNCW